MDTKEHSEVIQQFWDLIVSLKASGVLGPAFNKTWREAADNLGIDRKLAGKIVVQVAEGRPFFDNSEPEGGPTYAGGVSKEEFYNDPDELLISGSVNVPFADSAKKIYSKMAEDQRFFLRGGSVTQISISPSGSATFGEVDSYELQNIAPKFFNKGVLAVGAKKNEETGEPEFYKKASNLSSNLCCTMLGAPEKELLPSVNIITSAPVLWEGDGGVIISRKGYNPDVMGGAFVTGGESIRPDTVQEAAEIILEMFEEFHFVEENDRTRKIAMLLTPALVQTGLVGGHVPMDFSEANQSQSGKTLLHQLVTAVYNESPSVVAQRNGGVGSFDESLGDALLKGRQFIKFDNLRGRLDSPLLESIMTADYRDSVTARALRKSGEVVAGLYLFQASTNGLLATPDIMNRSIVSRIRKRPDNYVFKRDILEQVRLHQGKYLGAVHRIIEEWIARGKPQSNEGRHDFRQWARKLDWIMTNLFGRPGLLDGHRDIQARTSVPILVKLREIAISIKRTGRLEEKFQAVQMIEFADDEGIDLGAPKGRDNEGKAKWLGGQLKNVFENTEKVRLDEIVFHRTTRNDERTRNKVKVYWFESTDPNDPPF